ncbi:MAG TPA: NAD(P)-dependent oxidoreductase [Thermoleophilaceae bacterium]|jgi:nucleoside-diphosphate-sugar epimerase
MRYLVTGALGAIGAWTVRALLDRGHDVVTYDLGGSEHRLRLALSDDEIAALTRVDGDVRELAQLERVMNEYEVNAVIHLAALQVPFVRADPVAGAQVNVTGTVNVFEAVRRSDRMELPVVYASSIAALAHEPGAHPSTLYGIFKRANEGTAERYFADYGVSSVGLRPHTVYGPGRDQGVTSAPTAAMVAAAQGREFQIPFGGSAQFQYVADAGEAFVRASEARLEGASVHNLDGPVATMQEVIGTIEQAAPEAAGLITAAADPLPFPSSVDPASFIELVGGPVSRPLADGVAESIARFRT